MTNHKLPFSQREKYRPLQKALQLEELTQEFRSEIELCLTKALELFQDEKHLPSRNKQTANWEVILRDIWVQFLSNPLLGYIDMFQVEEYLIRIIRCGVFYQVFDVVEELVKRTASDQPRFYKDLEAVFKRRKVAYRLVGSDSLGFAIIPTTNEFEVLTVDTTFDLLSFKADRFDSVSKHLIYAGQLLKKGEYSKSISESSSAVEATLRILTISDKGYSTVSKEYCGSIKIHPALNTHIEKLYQFASDISDGRHSKKQAGYNADQFDAQYMFSNCCSTIQYFINKQSPIEED